MLRFARGAEYFSRIVNEHDPNFSSFSKTFLKVWQFISTEKYFYDRLTLLSKSSLDKIGIQRQMRVIQWSGEVQNRSLVGDISRQMFSEEYDHLIPTSAILIHDLLKYLPKIVNSTIE